MSQGGEKTEQPTEKRLRESRRKGQVARSQDLTSALLMLGALAALWASGAWAFAGLADAMGRSLGDASHFSGELDAAAALSALGAGLKAATWALAPLLGVLFALALLVGFLQTGPVFSFESVRLNAEHINPAQNFQKKFLKGRPYIELVKTLLKIAAASLIVSAALWGARFELLGLAGQGTAKVTSYVLSLTLTTGLKVGLAFLLIGGGDYLLQRFLHLRELRMTKQEVKHELKDSEGDPLIKGARRQLHFEIATRNMVAAVKGATVVVINPTHVAVALRYDAAAADAPTVVAKGAELIASEIRKVAAEAGVPIVRDVPLARALYDLELDAEIPDELFEAVAGVLRFVYKLAQERGEV
jgi:flagellar biosynthesis protein FlhB